MKGWMLGLVLCGCSLEGFAQGVLLDFSGRVTDKTGKGMAGVVVNDGISFTQTDAKGAWALVSDTTRSKFVSISTPAAYVLPQTDGIADAFYVSVGILAKNGGKHDFVLERRKQPANKFYYIAISDPQVRNDHDMKRWRQEALPDIGQTIDSLKAAREVIGMTLGDLVYDNMDLWDEYKASVENMGATFFQCIGNHDFDQRYQDLHNMATGTPVYGEMMYHRYFGPTDYSFNIGKVHVVTMKNLNYLGHRRYIESVTGDQLAWLKKDLSYLPKGSLVFLNMHAAAWNRVTTGNNIRNAEDLQEVLKDYKVHVFCGHTHFLQNVEVTPDLYEHNVGAACGSWWAGWINQCGAPNGYLVMDVDGENLKWRYKSTRRDFSYQFRVYGKGEFASQSSFVVANVWDWDSKWRVVWYQDGKPMGEMEQFDGMDANRLKEVGGNPMRAIKTPHLFRVMPSDGAKEIKIEATNRFGETFSQTIQL